MTNGIVPYPHPKYAPGSNQIGQFEIGVSPIGTIPAWDEYQTVLSQYGNSPILLAFIQSFCDAVDPTLDFDEFYDTMWNVETAVGYGLDIWGRIVGVSRIFHIPSEQEYLGFLEAGSWVGFGQAPLYSGQSTTQNYLLPDDQYRQVILAKAATNIWDGTISTINKILMNLFPTNGNCYVIDNQNLTMSYYFENLLTPINLAIASSGILPKPPGVALSIVQG